jgi:hypothetical protein
MPRRDIPREHIGELIEKLLIKARDEGDVYLENAKVSLENDGHVVVFLNNNERVVYNIRVQRSGWRATR